ncbi:MAG TPA: hypothetical protein VLV86_20265 [Vicinamibacterales bacterium]|nr:hypothetical protein [Vicinamibacterales bacterium]
MRERLLIRHFLLRFTEHDLISTNADRREVLAVTGGTLVSVSLFLATLTALRYQFNNFMPPGITSMNALDDRFLFVSASMLVMALLAVSLWDSLALDPRDTAVLGILPLRRSVLTRSKFIAVATLGVAADVGWNAAPTLLRFAALPLALRVGFKGIVVLTLAQAVTTVAAGAFGFLSVIALRETLTAVFGHERFQAMASAIQAVLIVALMSALLLLPARSSRVAETWLARDSLAADSLPPLWFVGLHETFAGAVIDDAPHVAATARGAFAVPVFRAQERAATTLYRSLRPRYRRFGRLAVTALLCVTILTVVTSAWNSRRLPMPPHRPARSTSAIIWCWTWTVEHLLTTSLVQQGGFWFTLQTLPRRATHRAVLASALAVGVSSIVITSSSRIGVLSAQFVVLAALLTGFRHALRLPADLRAGATVRLAWNGDLSPFVSGVKRAGWVAIVIPALVALFVWHTALIGVSVAILQLCLGVAFSLFMMELLFIRHSRLPLVSGYVPSADAKSRGLTYVGGVLLLCVVLGAIDRMALDASSGYVLLLAGVIAGIGTAIHIVDRASGPAAFTGDLDEDVAMPTQRLNLAG